MSVCWNWAYVQVPAQHPRKVQEHSLEYSRGVEEVCEWE